MNRHQIEIEIDVNAETRAAAGHLADLVVEFVERRIEEDPALSLTMSVRPTCTATVRDEQ